MKSIVKLMFVLALLPGAARLGFSRGDKIIPQVVDGPGWKTKFDLTNISPAVAISKMTLSFYKNDGSKWVLQTNQGTASDFTLSIGPRQTLRVETLGAGTMGSGYAVIYDMETGEFPTTGLADYVFSTDYVLGISVFYVVSTSSGVTDTVTVSTPQVTAAANIPIEIDSAQGIYSGVSIVNWFGSSNKINIDLYPQDWTSGNPIHADFTLPQGQQRAEFLDQNLFPTLKTFKGMAEITADGPIALVGLLQTRASDFSDRYSTLVPVDKESLRRNSYIVLLQTLPDDTDGIPLDIDNFAVDFRRSKDNTDDWSWDLVYNHAAGSVTNRFLHPLNFAAVATLGVQTDDQFDGQLTLPYLKTLNYTTDDIDMSGSNLEGFTFAVRTDLRNYAKVRILRVIKTTSGLDDRYRDMVLEVVVYK